MLIIIFCFLQKIILGNLQKRKGWECMNYLSIEYNDNSVVLKNVKDFDVKQTFECGQSFRWEKESDYKYIGIAFGRVLEVEQIGEDVILHNTSRKDFEDIWYGYFDLDKDYTTIKRELSQDATLRKAIEFGYGIRLLKQEPFELVISFIISARNSIPVISKTIKNISQKWGSKIEYKGKDYYTFPSVDVLSKVTVEEMREIGASFRSKYIVDTTNKIYEAKLIKQGNLKVEDSEDFLAKYDLDEIIALDDDTCHKVLQNYMGVGAKVADCIMLFAMGKHSAFPVDVWVKRAMIHFYNASDASLAKIRILGRNKFGKFSGFAQQYLFYYTRENGIKL